MTRELPPAEWDKLLAFSPFREHGLPQRPDSWRILVHEEGGEIVGFLCLLDAVHTEGWWVREDYRKHPKVLIGLIRGMLTALQAAEIPGVFCVVPDDLLEQQDIVQRFGFQPAAGSLYLLAVPPPATEN